jgi:hypothetical protein
MLAIAEREQAKNTAAAAIHQEELKHQARSMEAQWKLEMEHQTEVVAALAKIAVPEVVEVVVEKQIFVEVEVLPPGAERPPPLFIAGQSVHQWWATWMAGAYETPSGIKGKNGRPAWYSASVRMWEQFCHQACRDAGVPGVALCGE